MLSALTSPTTGDSFRDPLDLKPWSNKDRQSCAFTAARKRNFLEVRDALGRAGFKPEIINGDDFCEWILRSMMKATESGEEDNFVAFKGKLGATPSIELNGNILARPPSTPIPLRLLTGLVY